jgi:F420-dependent NADP oxidoreductase-like protein
LGTAWHNRGHDVTSGVRNPDDPRYASLGTIRANEAAASDAEVVVSCTPWPGTQEPVQGCGDLSGKVLIDAINPLYRGLISELGFEAVHAVDRPQARFSKPRALLWIHLALRRGFGTDLLRGRA